MTFNAFYTALCQRTGPAYGAGPSGFKRLMKRLGNPQENYKIIHVAGTNGKGSVCYLCAQILQSAGYQTGLFISPHLQSPAERIQMNGQKMAQTVFIRICQKVLAAEEEKLNFFEVLTAVAFLYFAEKKAEYVVLETGLGGRKDPTNVCTPAASVITSIGLEHCAVLGHTLAQIAYEKAGIIKRKVPVFVGAMPAQALAVIKQTAQALLAPLSVVKTAEPFRLGRTDWQKNQTILQKGTHMYTLCVLGEKQVQNACLVYHVCRHLGLAEEAIKKGFSRVYIPGRFEVCRAAKKTIILDGAHNPQAVENLMKFIAQSPYGRSLAVLCAFRPDKDYPAMLQMITKQAKKVYLTAVPRARCARAKDLLAYVPPAQCGGVYVRPGAALRAALSKYDVVLVSGSFYLVGYIQTYLRQSGTFSSRA